MLDFLFLFLVSEQGEIFHLLHENLRAGWEIFQTQLSEQALLIDA